MPRKPRDLQPDYCYHVTVRCNNREFHLASAECWEVFLYAIKKAQEKYGFVLYALCIMANHVHYLIESKAPEDLPKIMHWLNWYTAMCFNRIQGKVISGSSGIIAPVSTSTIGSVRSTPYAISMPIRKRQACERHSSMSEAITERMSD